MFNFIEVVIDFNNKLYKKGIKKIQLILKKKQKSSLNQQLNISKKKFVLIKNTII